MTSKEKDIIVLEHTIKSIFNKENIRSIDVTIANKLFAKWIVLTEYKSNNIITKRINILDEEPNY